MDYLKRRKAGKKLRTIVMSAAVIYGVLYTGIRVIMAVEALPLTV